MISDARIKVSVCVPVYKVETCVEQCARSLFEQTMKAGIEFVFVDDCSPDGSVDAIKRVLADYHERQGQVRFIHNAVNSGASVTRNNALEASAGEYVLFVDADDVLESDWTEWAIAAAERTDADCVFGRVTRCASAEDGRRIAGHYETANIELEGDERWRVQEELLKSATDILPNLPYVDLGPCGKLFRRAVLADVRFPTGIKCSEDQVFVHAAVRKARKIVLTNRSAYLYICNLSSSTHRMKQGVLESIFRAQRLVRGEQVDFGKTANAFYWRIIEESWMGFCMENFAGRDSRPLRETIRSLRDLRGNEPLLAEALAHVHMSRIASWKHRLKVGLLVYCPRLCLALKTAKERLKAFRGRN